MDDQPEQPEAGETTPWSRPAPATPDRPLWLDPPTAPPLAGTTLGPPLTPPLPPSPPNP
ncbi:MAG: hypothetical protein QOD63_1311, partial [Actinomycetota bacterium]|nr:hypothetical protein [Actinomycetota bacterium]